MSRKGAANVLAPSFGATGNWLDCAPFPARTRAMLLMLYLIAITAEAMTGALSAGRRGMDWFGVVLIACVTALGAARCATCCWALPADLGEAPGIPGVDQLAPRC
jgi:Predicted membrane protein